MALSILTEKNRDDDQKSIQMRMLRTEVLKRPTLCFLTKLPRSARPFSLKARSTCGKLSIRRDVLP